MARFTGENVEQYSQSSGSRGSFFSLKNDMDCARVRFMYSKPEDMEGFSVHKVQVGDKERYVNCLRDYDSPIDDCPFCRERMKLDAKFFVPLYNVDTEEVQIWERGKKFYGKISGFFARNPNLVSGVFDVERHGKPRDTATTYEIYPVETDDTTLEDLPEIPQILGGIVLEKTAEDMEDYLATGSFPPTDEQPARRQSSRAESEDRGVTRRTPSNRGRGDRF